MLSNPTSPPKLTSREQALLSLLPLDGSPLTTWELAASYYGDELPRVQHARTIIQGRMSSIVRKSRLIPGHRPVMKSARAGPQPMKFWLG